MQSYGYCYLNEYAKNGVWKSLDLLYKTDLPVIVCIGTSKVAGDSLGPFVGSFLKEKNLNAIVYGNLNCPITALNVPLLNGYLKKMHPNSKILVIDSAVGDKEEIGCIKVADCPIKPGLGAKKDLPYIGDVSIMGIVADKTKNCDNQLISTNLNLIYAMAKIISDAIESYVYCLNEQKQMLQGYIKINKITA